MDFGCLPEIRLWRICSASPSLPSESLVWIWCLSLCAFTNYRHLNSFAQHTLLQASGSLKQWHLAYWTRPAGPAPEHLQNSAWSHRISREPLFTHSGDVAVQPDSCPPSKPKAENEVLKLMIIQKARDLRQQLKGLFIYLFMYFKLIR